MSDSWTTPPEIVELVRRIAPGGRIDLDPCCHPLSSVVATTRVVFGHDQEFWSPSEGWVVDDGLQIPWEGFVYCNPPYSQIAPWVDKAIASVKTAETLLLTPPSSASWFHRLLVTDGSLVCFMRKRIQFLPRGKHGNPKDSVFSLIGGKPATRDRFMEIFREHGSIMIRLDG